MRGEIQNRQRAAQLRDFSGLRFGAVTPTDIDGFVEFGDRLFVWIEAKLRDTVMPAGQRLALERQCDAVAASGRRAVVLVIEHDVPPAEDIDFSVCPVRQYRVLGEWHEPAEAITCREAIEKLRGWAGFPL
jgi:hypothetical protein